MHKNSVMEEERVKVSHPAANGETLSAGNHQNRLCLLSEVDFETNILQISVNMRDICRGVLKTWKVRGVSQI